MAGAMKYAFSPTMNFGSPKSDSESILGTFWMAKKTSISEIPFFLILADFRRSGGVQTSCALAPFSLFFRSWGLFFLLRGQFWRFSWIFMFLDLLFDDLCKVLRILVAAVVVAAVAVVVAIVVVVVAVVAAVAATVALVVAMTVEQNL